MSFGGGKKPVSKQPTKALGIDFQGAQYGPPLTVLYGQNKTAGNCAWYGDFQAIAQQQKQSGGKGGGGSSSTTSYTYKASYQLVIAEGVGSIVNVYNGTSTVSIASLGAVVATGTQGQAPWSHLSGAAALGYSGTILVSFANRDLGSSASLPNDNFEVAGLLQHGGGIVDADPSAVFSDICTDTQHGMSGVVPLASLSQWSNYCVAAGLFVSPVYDQQDTAQSALEDLLKYGNAAAWFSEGVVKVGCYGDQTITGNGVTYTPNLTSVASLGPDDFITNGSGAPVTITRVSPADALNLVRVEYQDRANTYHTSAVVASFDQDMIANGARSDDSESVHMATNATVARLIAQNLLQRSFYVRNQYEFKLSWRYCYLEPFDIVQLTDANTGLNASTVRIISIEEDEHGLLDVTAEEFPEGIGHSEAYSTQANAGTTVDPNSDPGPVAGPYLFRGPGFLVGNNKPEIWCAVTGDGNPLWAGCDVYLSHDGTSYTYVCSYARQARYGHITNSIGVQADPDSVSAPNVVLNGHNTQLLGGSKADADQFITLAMIDDEIVSYETATLVSGPSYNLSYLRRGGYGTAISDHSANAPFVRLDDGILRIPVDPSQIGQTIYLKFLSVNCFGRTPRTLSGETAYQYVIGTNVELPDVPVTPANFSVQGVADGVSITWTNDNPAAVGCTSIEYATASGGPWSVLAQVGPTTTGYHHSFVTGATYYYRARARGPLVQSGWSAYTSVFNSAGVNVSAIANNALNALTTPQTNGNYVTGNPSFTINKLGTATGTSFTTGGQQIVDGWICLGVGSQGVQQWEAANFAYAAAHPYLSLRSGSIANGASYTNFIGSSPNFPCQSGQQFYVNANFNHAWNTTPPSGVGLRARIGVKWYKADGTPSATPETVQDFVVSAQGTQTVGMVLTTPTDAATGVMYCGQVVYNNSGATYTITGLPFDTRCTFAAASTVIPQGKLTPINWMGVRSILNTSPLTYSINTATPAGITFSCAAVTVRGGTNQLVNYNAASASTTQARGTTVTYYFYFIDPNQQGGSQTLQFTTNVYDLSAQDGIVNLGNCSITVPASGGGSGSGGGGGGWCVCDDMWVDSRTQAKDAKPGHVFDCCDLPTRGTETFQRALHSVDYHDEQCVRITTERGAVLDCGITTPFDTMDGRTLRAPDMAGELVLTDRGLERVLTVEPIGVRRVCYFHFGGVSYAAGADPCHRIYSHNAGTNPSKP